MLNIVCVCHNGMGTSMLLKINVNNICMENGISASVDACAHGEAAGFLMNADIVLTSPEIVEMLPPTEAQILQTTNMLDFHNGNSNDDSAQLPNQCGGSGCPGL